METNCKLNIIYQMDGQTFLLRLIVSENTFNQMLRLSVSNMLGVAELKNALTLLFFWVWVVGGL